MKTYHLLSLSILLVLVFTSCKDLAETEPASAFQEEFYQPEGVVLGEQFEPSWGVESMRSFYSDMSEAFPNARLASAEEAIQASHYYIRFLPLSTEEYDTLMNAGVEMYPYPLDYALEQNGEIYYDPENESDTIVWQYAVIDKELNFPDFVKHEILQETYMPLEEESEGIASGRTQKVMLDDEVSTAEFLEMCALLDNNLLDSALTAMNLLDSIYYYEDEEGADGGRTTLFKRRKFRLRSPFRAIKRVFRTVRNVISSIRILKWGPKGNIRVQYVHPRTGTTVTEGVANVEVIARQGLINRRTFTRADGSYAFEFPAFAPVWYNVKFQNNHAIVRYNFGFLTAIKSGGIRAVNRGWNYTFTSSDSWGYSWACVMNAVNDYYKVLPSLRDEHRTEAPPRHLKIRVTNGRDLASRNISRSGWAHFANQTTPAFLSPLTNDIGVHRIDGSTRFTYDRVYATTIHELGHAAHWNLVGWNSVQSGINMIRTDEQVRETWADAVMQFAYRRKFNPNVALNTVTSSVTLTGPWVTQHQQCNFSINQMGDYVYVLGPDMWDDFNQSCQGVTDNVSNIPLIDLYRSLKDARTWDDWRDEIIERHPNQRAEITNYFNQF